MIILYYPKWCLMINPRLEFEVKVFSPSFSNCPFFSSEDFLITLGNGLIVFRLLYFCGCCCCCCCCRSNRSIDHWWMDLPIVRQKLNVKRLEVSISPIFYEQLYCTKLFCRAFFYLQFGFVIFCRKNIGAKAVGKMLMKLTPIVNFTNILQAIFSFKSGIPRFFF